MASWKQTLAAVERAAAELAKAVEAMPAGEQPDDRQAKALRRATGQISAHAGALKKALGVGSPQKPTPARVGEATPPELADRLQQQDRPEPSLPPFLQP